MPFFLWFVFSVEPLDVDKAKKALQGHLDLTRNMEYAPPEVCPIGFGHQYAVTCVTMQIVLFVALKIH